MLTQHTCGAAHVVMPHGIPPSLGAPPELDAPDEELPSSRVPPPLVVPVPPPSGLALFDVDPPHAAASATPNETAKRALVLVIAMPPAS